MIDDSEKERIGRLSVMLAKKLVRVCEQFISRLEPQYIALNLVHGAVTILSASGYGPDYIIPCLKDFMLSALAEEVKAQKAEQQKLQIH